MHSLRHLHAVRRSLYHHGRVSSVWYFVIAMVVLLFIENMLFTEAGREFLLVRLGSPLVVAYELFKSHIGKPMTASVNNMFQ